MLGVVVYLAVNSHGAFQDGGSRRSCAHRRPKLDILAMFLGHTGDSKELQFVHLTVTRQVHGCGTARNRFLRSPYASEPNRFFDKKGSHSCIALVKNQHLLTEQTHSPILVQALIFQFSTQQLNFAMYASTLILFASAAAHALAADAKTMEGYTIVPASWQIEVSPGRVVTLNGTIQDAIAQAVASR